MQQLKALLQHDTTCVSSQERTITVQPEPQKQNPMHRGLAETTATSTDLSSISSPASLRSDSEGTVVLEMGEDKQLLVIAQLYELPPIVRAVADSYIHTANTMALVTALFAGVQVAMAQIVLNNYSPSENIPRVWQALHWLIYASICLNSGSTASSLAFINYTNYLASSARVLLLTDPCSWPYQVYHGEPLPLTCLNVPFMDSDFDLMMKFGLKRNMRRVWDASCYGCYTGSGLLLASMGVWVWLNEGLAVALSLTILILPPAAWLISSFFFTAEHSPKVPKLSSCMVYDEDSKV